MAHYGKQIINRDEDSNVLRPNKVYLVTVTVVVQDLCWLGRVNKKNMIQFSSRCTFYHQHCSPNLHANFCNSEKLFFFFCFFFNEN